MDRFAPFTHCQIVPGTCARPPAYLLWVDFLLDSEHLLIVCGPKHCCLSAPTTSSACAPLWILMFLWCLRALALLRAITIPPAGLTMRTFQCLLPLLPCWLIDLLICMKKKMYFEVLTGLMKSVIPIFMELNCFLLFITFASRSFY